MVCVLSTQELATGRALTFIIFSRSPLVSFWMDTKVFKGLGKLVGGGQVQPFPESLHAGACLILRESISGLSCGREGFSESGNIVESVLASSEPLPRVWTLQPSQCSSGSWCSGPMGPPSSHLSSHLPLDRRMGAGAQVSRESVASVSVLRELVRWGDHSLFQKCAEAVGVQCRCISVEPQWPPESNITSLHYLISLPLGCLNFLSSLPSWRASVTCVSLASSRFSSVPLGPARVLCLFI